MSKGMLIEYKGVYRNVNRLLERFKGFQVGISETERK